jgi:tRNA dimethylallyltransferase
MSRTTAEAILLLGPTASGKSALAMRLAEKLPLEIVSIDSAQVYRGMDIGTAKPTAAERARVPHHLLDLRDPHETYSAADFVRDATRAIAGIRARGRLPLVVGGTMLYAKALREGLSALPPADAAIRARLSAEASERGWPALHSRLVQVDPATAMRLPPNDSQRIQRALEVFELTGVPLSTLQTGAGADAVRFPIIALLPQDRAALRERIARRFAAMLDAGLVDELRALRARYPLHRELPSMRSVGYRQAWAFLEGECTREQFVADALTATRGLAKRQMTWLRSMHDAAPVDPDACEAFDRVLALLRAAQ